MPIVELSKQLLTIGTEGHGFDRFCLLWLKHFLCFEADTIELYEIIVCDESQKIHVGGPKSWGGFWGEKFFEFKDELVLVGFDLHLNLKL